MKTEQREPTAVSVMTDKSNRRLRWIEKRRRFCIKHLLGLSKTSKSLGRHGFQPSVGMRGAKGGHRNKPLALRLACYPSSFPVGGEPPDWGICHKTVQDNRTRGPWCLIGGPRGAKALARPLTGAVLTILATGCRIRVLSSWR